MRRLAGVCSAAAMLAGCATTDPDPTPLACPVYVAAVSPPSPVYPDEAAREGISDTCESRFDIDWQGRPFNLDVRCTYLDFARSAEDALRTTTFDPQALERSQIGSQCASYPFSYEISD